MIRKYQEIANLKKIAIQSYRNLLRTQRRVFGSDLNTLNRNTTNTVIPSDVLNVEAWNKSRTEFEANKGILDLEVLKKVN